MAVWTLPNIKKLDEAIRWDAEAFSPFLLSLDKKFKNVPRLSELATVTHASEITRTYTTEADSKLFLLAQNIRPVLPEILTEFRIPKDVAESIPTNRLKHCDVLVTRSGAYSGMCAVYLGDDGECYTSGEGLIVRCQGKIDGAYLAVFLNTITGRSLCKRAIYGSGQPHIGPKYLEQIYVPRLGKVEKQAGDLVRSAYSDLKDAEKLYPEAENELLERLGWKKLTVKPVELSYSANSSELVNLARFDAEFFQPKHHRLTALLEDGGSLPLQKISTCCHRGVQPIYKDDGEILVINSKHLGSTQLDLSDAERTTRDFFEQKDTQNAQLKHLDVLVYSTGAYIGRTNTYLSNESAIASNHVTIVRPDPKICNPVYLALFMNSPAGLIQAEQFATGSAQRELYPTHLSDFLIYLPQKNGVTDLDWQKRLAKKVETASVAKIKSHQKLGEAVKLVENALVGI